MYAATLINCFSNLPCMFHVFFTLYLFIVIKVTKKWSQQQHKLTVIPMLIRGLSKMNWYKNPLIWYFLYSLFFCISNDWFILFNLFPLLYLLTAIFHNQVIITKVSWSYCCTGFKTEGTCQKHWVPSSTGLGMQ